MSNQNRYGIKTISDESLLKFQYHNRKREYTSIKGKGNIFP